ncbi:DUF2460 domain-containing protein [Pontixanthobacter sp.]|uniref:DUF2460 domain-containing protein n=1 Tax=Pontixanthobacter sp. TaxID=2792078 RepID=UPI003C7BE839
MAFWLARGRNGQDSDYIQRFDPRFWTMNFPRPMMGSVTTISADSLRIDCDFYSENDLAGLIWTSEDTLSHPLLRYETSRDYTRTTLRFHWQSAGLIPLDQPNGPTLTIEGRDDTGAERVWYVRLWNYAQGSPTNAQITLPFSDLESGYSLPGEPVPMADIDRMFISLVPPNYRAGSDQLLPARRRGRAMISAISCDGDKPLLGIGDVMVPPHGERIATAYDDAYNQTPARLVREALALGYRDTLLHYVGMSHFFQLEQSGSRLIATADGQICASALRWHHSFLSEAKAAGYDVVISLSYELFAEHCPEAWQQVAFDGEAGRTGWEPPSALLSPANDSAMAWLRSVAGNFIGLQSAAGLPVRFQIGEPWWWISDGSKPCLYDAASTAAFTAEFGTEPPVIETLQSDLNLAQTAFLDWAGAVLAQSTLDLAQAVRDAAPASAEISLLVFTPTILDPKTPELVRANVPIGWAWPAFDRLQLEDYDWLTDGADGLRKTAYAAFDQRLGYPAAHQDYLSGFVLNQTDADLYWRRIDRGLDDAAERGVTVRYVWAQPQIARDGYTRLPPIKDTDMLAFDDVLYPLPFGSDAAVSPEFATTIAVTASGHERRNSQWSDARLHFDVGPGIRSEQELGTLIAFFRARRGAACGFRIGDPFDYSSNQMTGLPAPDDQHIGTGDGLQAAFALVKAYGTAENPQIRRITRPREETILIAVNGERITDWQHSGKGTITFAAAPPEGAHITAGFLFDVPVRFAEDRLNINSASFAAGEAASVPLIEVREAV